MKINYSTVSLPAEKRMAQSFSSPVTPLKDKGSYVLKFKNGHKANYFYCPLDDLRIVHVEKSIKVWEAKITLDGETCLIGKSKKPLFALGDTWEQAVQNVLAIKQFFFHPSFEWLSWHDLSHHKPRLVAPNDTRMLPKHINAKHPTQEWLNSMAEPIQERKTVYEHPKVRADKQQAVKTKYVRKEKVVNQQLRGIGLKEWESDTLTPAQKDELLLKRLVYEKHRI